MRLPCCWWVVASQQHEVQRTVNATFIIVLHGAGQRIIESLQNKDVGLPQVAQVVRFNHSRLQNGFRMTKHQKFPLHDLLLQPVARRGHDLKRSDCLKLPSDLPAKRLTSDFTSSVQAIIDAREQNHSVILMMGGHLIKLGLSRFIVDLIENNIITHVAANGAAIIHDYELAAWGGTSENVAKWITEGQFGLWQETSQLNEIIKKAADKEEGIGEAGGEGDFFNRLLTRPS